MVAEEQLRIPASWLEELEVSEAQLPQPSTSGKLEVEDKEASISVRNESTGLHVEVSSAL